MIGGGLVNTPFSYLIIYGAFIGMSKLLSVATPISCLLVETGIITSAVCSFFLLNKCSFDI